MHHSADCGEAVLGANDPLREPEEVESQSRVRTGIEQIVNDGDHIALGQLDAGRVRAAQIPVPANETGAHPLPHVGPEEPLSREGIPPLCGSNPARRVADPSVGSRATAVRLGVVVRRGGGFSVRERGSARQRLVAAEEARDWGGGEAGGGSQSSPNGAPPRSAR